jgi:hypothetical protein
MSILLIELLLPIVNSATGGRLNPGERRYLVVRNAGDEELVDSVKATVIPDVEERAGSG